MSSSSPWDAYSQHTGLTSSLEPYAHPFSTDMRNLAGGTGAPGMSSLTGESMLGYPKSSDLSAAANLNLASPYGAYGQSYPGMPDLGFPGASLRPSSATHSPVAAAAENLPASSPHGQYSGTPTSETQSSSPAFSNSTSLYTPSTISSSIASSPYAQAFGSSSSSAAESGSRGPHFSPFAQSYGYPMYGYNQVGGFPTANSLDGVNRYMSGISSSQLMQSSAMGLYSNSQAGQMPFAYHPSMGWSPSAIPGFQLKEGADLMSPEELERYRYRQLSNPYFPGLPPGGPPGRNFPPHPLQQGMMRSGPFLDDRVHSPAPKKPKKSTEEAERPPTPAPRDPASFHSQRGIYLFTSNSEPGNPKFYGDRYVLYEKDLCEKLSRVSLPGKIQYVYNPLEYAFESHLKFVRRFCTGEKYILFVGMNPGPFGMSQNGVPFGECQIVKEWLQIDGEVLKPVLEHPKRRVVGLDCSRSEVTGGRFWQLFRTLCHTPEHFFRTSYVHNLCPFAFLTDTGKNVTPPQLTSSVLDQINALCNATLVEVVRLLKCKYVICIGKYALAQAQKALSADEFSGITLECLMHPSPINPAANKGWADIAIKQLTEIGIIEIIQYGRVPYQPQSQPPPSLSHPPHASSSSSMSHHPHHHHPYHNKQSPGHYGFQSPPVQSYHHSPAQGSNNNHHGQSPAHASGLSQSPAHAPSARNQSSPAHASSRAQSSPAHSSCSQSPAQPQQNQVAAANQSPSQTTGSGSSSSTLPGQPSSEQLQDGQKLLNKDNGEKGGSQDSSLDSSAAAAEKTQEGKGLPQLNTNGIPAYSGDSQGHENGLQNPHSEPGSQGSEVSKGNSPSIQYPSAGNPQVNATDSQLQNPQMSSANPQMTSSSQMNTTNPQMHMPLGSGHPHMGIGMSMSDSPNLQQGAPVDQHASLTNQQIGSPQMSSQNSHLGVSQNSHLGSMNSHMASSMGAHMGMGSQMGMGVGVPMGRDQGMSLHGQMGSINPYSQQQLDMSQMSGSYGAGPNSMSLNSYSGMRPSSSEMPGYAASHMGLQNPSAMGMASMSSMHSSAGGGGPMSAQQLGMFNPHMSRMMGPPEQQMGMHAGLSSMYDSGQLGKEIPPYGGHYTDKPPECS
ncbi:uncharacterized protein LOC118477113 [Aplysia californica]|uniref:Uncharacterized protein LOC118477113 n=1 Tax=Aplysia californica TaxID=6500 RepID=A0ABM1W0Y5_APLCA|nr:uncharacterized protein LOC118477113 [Aplysia californica]